jgi:hypothetical protein
MMDFSFLMYQAGTLIEQSVRRATWDNQQMNDIPPYLVDKWTNYLIQVVRNNLAKAYPSSDDLDAAKIEDISSNINLFSDHLYQRLANMNSFELNDIVHTDRFTSSILSGFCPRFPIC